MTENELRAKMAPLIVGQDNLMVIDVLSDLLVACVGRMTPEARHQRLTAMVASIEDFFRSKVDG